MPKTKNFPYLSMAIPSGDTKYSVIRWGWNGLNRTDAIDTGQLTDASGVMVDPPYITPIKKFKTFAEYAEPISIHGFGGNLFVVYRDGGSIKVDCVKKNRRTYTGTMGAAKGDDRDFDYRTAIQFNAASDTANIVKATYDRKILIFPDAYSIDFNVTADFSPASLGSRYPEIKYAAVYGSRVFGVDDNLVYASSYNDYADWDLDTADDYNEANAWVSMSQSNVKADGAFSAIAAYDNHVVLFKRDFMQLVYNNKNPFRIVDVGAYGCDNPYAVAEAGGPLYFASADHLYSYTGGVPRVASRELEMDSFAGAVLGSFKETLYVYVSECLYALKDGVWSVLGAVESGIKCFATLDYALAALCGNGTILLIDWIASELDEDGGGEGEAEYADDWWFETDFMALGRLDVRTVRKLSLLCDVAPGASVSAYLLKDGEKFDPASSRLVGTSQGTGQILMRVLVRQMSAYMHRLRVVGRGYAKIYAAELKIAWGGDAYVEG